jgi:hypothetical protein
MRYAFDQKAIGFINRVHAASEQIPLNEYGVNNKLTLLNVLWFDADVKCDWGGESDVVAENKLYGFMDDAHKRVEDAKLKGEYEALIWSLHDRAMNEILDLENRLFLAICVTNAMMAVEGSAANIFNSDQMLEHVDNEFRRDRLHAARNARSILETSDVFRPLFYKGDVRIVDLMDAS